MARTAFDIFGEESDTGIPPEGEALLNAIAENESAGDWNVIYGGSTFDSYDDHPRKAIKITSGPNKGKFSTAAGKFQILGYVFDDVAKKIGVTDFTPESQKKVAWYLIREKYKFNDTKLLNDLRSGDVSKVGRKLSGLWTSLAGGIEATQSDNNFNALYDQYLDLEGGQGGDDFLPPGGIADDPIRGFRARDSFNALLPALEAKLSPKRQAEQTNFIDSLTKAMDEALVVPKGMRPVTDQSDKKFASLGADLALAGSEFLHILAPQMIDPTVKEPPVDYTIPLELPKPLTLGDAPASAERLKGSIMTAENFIAEVERGERIKAATKPVTSGNMVRPAGPAAGMPKATSATTGATYAADAQLIRMAQDMRRAQEGKLRDGSVIKTSNGVAGTAELPKDYKPAANLMPQEKKKPVAGLKLPVSPTILKPTSAVRPEGKAAGMPAAKPKASESKVGVTLGNWKLPQIDLGLIEDKPKSESKPVNAVRPEGKAYGMPAATAKQPVKVKAPQNTVYANPASLSNPVLKAPAKPTTTTKTTVAAQPQIPPKSGLGMSQTTTKPAAKPAAKPTPAQLAAMDSLAGLTTLPPAKPMPGIVEVKKPAVQVTELPPAKKPVAKPVMSPEAPIPATMSSSTAAKRKPLDLGLTLSPTKVGTTQVTKKMEPKKFGADATPLDVIGDLLFGGGEKMMGSIGSLLNGDGPAKRGLLDPSQIDASIIGRPHKSVDGSTYYPIATPSGNTGYVNAKTGVKYTKDTGHTYGEGGKDYGSSPGQSTSGLKPGDRVYNPDTNSWALK